MDNNLSVFLAFGAGLLSFFSPCVLPLIPSWLCVIGGSPMTTTNDNEQRPKPVARTISFVSGFSVVFIILSIILSVTFNLLGSVFKYINIVSGLIVIILGLNIIFNFISILNFEKRFHIKTNGGGIIGAFLLGCAFGAGWTPCIGPVLTSIMFLAAQSGGIPSAVLYLIVFSLGLGLPFILAALFFDRFLKVSVKLRKFLPVIQRISGIVLIIIGILIMIGQYQALSQLAARLQIISL